MAFLHLIKLFCQGPSFTLPSTHRPSFPLITSFVVRRFRAVPNQMILTAPKSALLQRVRVILEVPFVNAYRWVLLLAV